MDGNNQTAQTGAEGTGGEKAEGTAAAASSGTTTEGTAAEHTYTEEEYSKALKAQAATAKAALLSELGFEGVSDADVKARLKAFTDYEDSQKSDAEKASEAQTKAASQLTAAKARITELERQVAAVTAGVPADKLARYVKLAESYMSEDVSFDAALKAAIADFPVATQSASASGRSTGISSAGSTGADQKVKDADDIARIFSRRG